MENENGTITISKEEYLKLIKRDFWLSCLEAGGVDNWSWYGENSKDYYHDCLEWNKEHPDMKIEEEEIEDLLANGWDGEGYCG